MEAGGPQRGTPLPPCGLSIAPTCPRPLRSGQLELKLESSFYAVRASVSLASALTSAL